MTASMNIPLFPIASVLIATVATAGADDYISAASQYGALGLMTAALGAFSVWMEKNRRKSEKEDREERREHHEALLKVIEQKQAAIDKKDDFIEKMASKGND